MRHPAFALFLAVGLVLGASVTDSAAQSGGAGFWEKMSGPGKWFYTSYALSVCLEGPRIPASKLFCTPDDGLLWLNLGVSYARAGAVNQGEELQSPGLQQIAFEPSVDLNAVTLFNYAPVYFGIGGGVHRFWGENVGLTRGSMEARLGIIFWRPGSLDFGFRYARKVFFKVFTAEDFGDLTGTYTTNGTDAIHTFFWYVAF